MSERFQVDLSGMVDLLSMHLYSGPQVYLRELLQNAVDAVSARSGKDSAAPAKIRLRCGADEHGAATLEVSDTGSGLTADEAGELLATIGRSSKRDPAFGLGRAEFIGQFGIGLLAAFMVAEQIEVRSLSATPGAVPVVWLGRSDGTFEVREDPGAVTEVGTAVRLIARPDAAHWLDPDTVLGLAREYGALLPIDVALGVPTPGGEELWRRITETELPWRTTGQSRVEHARTLDRFCEQTFGFAPLGRIDLDLPAAGVSGVAFLLPQAVSPGSGQHRVYVKRMLLGPRIDKVMPEWAFFARAVINADALSPTASREGLHEDEVLLAVREALGEQLKQWALGTLRQPTPLSRSFIETHHLALRALALTDDELLDLVAEILPYETTDGPMTLAEAANRGEILFAASTEAFRGIAAVARAQGIVVVNAGYVYDADLLAKLGARPGYRVRRLEGDDLVQVLRLPGLERELEIAGAVAAAREVLEADDCDVIVRGFAPGSVPAMLLRDQAGERRRDLDREREAAPDRWGGLLDAFAEDGARRSRTLVLNDDSPLARKLLAAERGEVFDAGLRAVYLSALMLAGEGLRTRETGMLAESLETLLDRSIRGTDQTIRPEPGGLGGAGSEQPDPGGSGTRTDLTGLTDPPDPRDQREPTDPTDSTDPAETEDR